MPPTADEFRPADRFGLSRVISPKGSLPQQAESVDPSLPIAEDELLIEVECLNIDSASFHQISKANDGDVSRIERHILDLVKKRGKHHNPVTGSGGMLIGRVTRVGPKFPVAEKPVKVGDRVATLVSLSLTPLEIRRIKAIHPKIDRVDVEGHAILFATGLFARLPSDIPDKVALAALDVAGAPAQMPALVKKGDAVVIVGGAGKSGVLCAYMAKKLGARKVIAIDYSDDAVRRAKGLSFFDEVIQGDARNAMAIHEAVRKSTDGKMADVVINVANIPETEMSCILSCRQKGIVYYFSMATSFTRAALGAEGVGADVDLRIGNGYTEGHADLTLNLLRESPELRKLFEETYSG
jgi:L-erythro-3,5-diaminohexanoate dehydrogenase